MSEFYLYADKESLKVMTSDQRKVILVGSDFGYANFGDVLQLRGTLEFYCQQTDSTAIPVYALDAISSQNYVEGIKRELNLNALLFISSHPVDTARLELAPVTIIRSISALHFYGGGMLNGMWGNYVLDVLEFMLDRAEGARYVISGQQVGEEIQDRLVAHVGTYKPRLFGVRDRESLSRLLNWNIDGQFSFDDAYEPLGELVKQIPGSDRNRVIGHMNISGYTREDLEKSIGNLLCKFRRIHGRFANQEFTLANAYNDKRSAVSDSLATVVAMESDFPYKHYSVIDIANAAYTGYLSKPELLAGQIAISCSYHFTMLLHLAGVPCWLISQNAYYDQKAKALNGQDSFEAFVDRPMVPDYKERIEARAVWRAMLRNDSADTEHKFAKGSLEIGSPLREMETFRWKESVQEEFDAQQSRLSELENGRKWLEDQRDAWEKAVLEREKLIAQLQDQIREQAEVNTWLASQRDAWEGTANEHTQSIARLQDQVSELTEIHAWLGSQRDAWEKAVSEREHLIAQLQDQIRELTKGNAWLSSQREAWEKVASEREQQIQRLTTMQVKAQD